MIIRKFGALLRGNATPFQLFAAGLLGTMLGFMPGFLQAPGLILAGLLILIILNANLGVAALVLGLAKLASLLLMPLSFTVGRWLLDGPTQGFFAKLINAPVFALFGFDYYATTGGLALSIVLGCLVGYLLSRAITAFRIKMAALDKTSEKFKQFSSRGSVRIMTWLLVGGSRKEVDYEALLKKKIGNPIRMLGVVFAVLVVVLLVLVQMFAAGPIVTAALQRGLERANGATVDVGSAELDLKGGRLTVNQLGMADPNALDTDLFRAATIEADISAASLLRKRLQLDRVVISDATSGEKRRKPGHRTVKPAPEVEEPPSTTPDQAKSLDDYLKDAKVWKERLAQARRWLEKLSGPEASESGTPEQQQETLEERLRREIELLGYARVRASHLVEGSPTLAVLELIAEKVRYSGLEGETLDIKGLNLSTQPWLLGKAPSLEIKSSGGTIDFGALVGSQAVPPTNNALRVHYKGLKTDDVAQNLIIAGQRPIQGGTIDLATQGTWNTQGGMQIDLPIEATLHNVTIAVAEGQETQIEELTLPIHLTGSLSNPRVKVDDKGLGNLLVQAGVSRAKDELGSRATDLLDEKVGGDAAEAGKGVLNSILGGKKKENP